MNSLMLSAEEIVYVKSNASLDEKTSETSFKVTEKIKEDVLKLNKITVSEVKYKVTGVYNRSNAKLVIEAMIKDGTIKTYSERYAELYPSVEVSP